MTRKLLLLLCLLALVFGIVSCSKSEDQSPADASSTSTNAANGEAGAGGTPPAGQPKTSGDSAPQSATPTTKGEELQVNPNAGNFKAGEKT